ncbi:hypothetical protein TFLX_05651 [Thermoflexales bacterium]|nr:hypothetical protein TFLX_05651 [Thermoflexales bacterium]
MSNPEELQRQIDESVRLLAPETLQRVKLAPWSDVTDLTMNVDVQVVVNNQPSRELEILSCRSVNTYFTHSNDPLLGLEEDEAAIHANILTAGGPLIIVREITGEWIVKGILRYLQLESARYTASA